MMDFQGIKSSFGPNDFKSFASKVRLNDSGQNWKDLAFSRMAEALYFNFRSPNKEDLLKHADLISPYIELVRHDWGLPAVKRTIQWLSECGAPGRGLATASQISCRAGRDYEIAVEIAGGLWDKFNDDAIVSIVYAQALAATGKVDLLDRVAEDVWNRLNLTPWGFEQWSRILLDCGRLEMAGKFNSELPGGSLFKKQNELRLLSFEKAPTNGNFPLTTFAINLDRETRKWTLAERVLPLGGYRAKRFSAIDGRELPGFALSRLGATREVLVHHGAGAIATALSHIAVWEKFLAGQDERCLILEDDATPFTHWSFHERNLEATKEIDLVWANERMSHALNPEGFPDAPVATPWEVLGSRPQNIMGLGTDAYLLTRNGAQKLLSLFEGHGIQGHIDGQMGAYAIENSDNEAVTRSQSTIAGLRRRLPKLDQISSVCLSIPMVKATDYGSSNTAEISLDKRLALKKQG